MIRQRTSRPALTIVECSAALAGLAIALMLVTQAAHWALGERQRGDERQEATEAVANLLEAARAQPWDSLTPEWASRQQLPEALGQRLHEPKLVVMVEPEKGPSQARRVSVELTWKTAEGQRAKPLRMVGLLSPRSAPTTGGKS